jgi:hypothetical protein
MRIILLTTFLVLLVGMLIGLGVGVSHAQVNAGMVDGVTNQINAGASGAGFGAAINPYSITANYVKMLLGLVGTVFTFLIIWAGYEYFTAKGDEDQAKEGLKKIKAAIIGLAIVLASYSITVYIVSRSQAAIGGAPAGQGVEYK